MKLIKQFNDWSSLNEDNAEFKKKILQGTGSPARELLDYNQATGLKFE